MNKDNLIEKLKLQFAEILTDESKLTLLEGYFNFLVSNKDKVNEPTEDYSVKTDVNNTSLNSGLIPDWYHEELLKREKQFLKNSKETISLANFKSKVEAKYGF